MTNSENTASIDETHIEAKSIHDPVKNKRRILLQLLGYCGLFGIYSVFLPYINPLITFLVYLPFVALCVHWCHEDSKQRGYTIGKLMRLGLIFVFAIVFPFYLLRTRGLGGMITLGQAILFSLAMGACALTTSFVTLLIGYLTGAWKLDL